MRYWVLAAGLLAGFLLQTTVLVYLKVGGVTPDLMLALTVAYGLLFGPALGIGAGIVSGLLLDLIFGKYIGLHILSLGFAGVLAGWVEHRIFKDNPLLPVAAGLAGTLISESIVIGCLTVLSQIGVSPWEYPLQEAYLKVIAPAAAYNAIVTYLVYGRLFRYYHYLRPDPRGTIVLRRQ